MQKDVEVSEIVTGQKVVVLFSGDSGFYSGAASMYRALQEEISAGRLQASVRILSGISSVAYLAACIGESYQDAAVYSMHGKELLNLAERDVTETKQSAFCSTAVRTLRPTSFL